MKTNKTTQTWIIPGSTRYDENEYFYVMVENGYTLLGEYYFHEQGDRGDETDVISRFENVKYNTTYGVDSSHWFDIPRFC